MDVVQLRDEQFMSAELKYHYATITEINAFSTAHSHTFFELFIIARGEIIHNINNNEQIITSGSLVFIRPKDIHSFKKAGSATCHMINLAFTKEMALDAFNYLGLENTEFFLKPETPPHIKLAINEVESLLDKLEFINTYAQSAILQKRVGFKVVLLEMISKFYSIISYDQSISLPDWLKELCLEMQEIKNFTQGMPKLYQIAARTPEHVSRSFKKFMGITPVQYLTGLRINYAKNLLVTSDHRIIDICQKVGFESLSHFNHIFKEQLNVSPSKFRKANRNIIIPSN